MLAQGESAGSVATCMFAFSPVTKGMFKRLIMESGECTGPWGPTTTKGNINASEAFMESVNASNLKELQALSINTLLNSAYWTAPDTAVDGYFLPLLPSEIPTHMHGGEVILGGNSEDNMCTPPFANATSPVRGCARTHCS